jgi:hypothetical protein
MIMKLLPIVFAILLGAGSTAFAQTHAKVTTPIDGQTGWNLALDWEFSVAASWPPHSCATGWAVCNDLSVPYNAVEADCYDPAMRSIPGDGYLHLTTALNSCLVNGTTYAFHAGTTRTANPMVGQGYIEVRAKVANFSGVIPNWPAIWLVGNNWPTGGEIDIFEGMTGKAFATYHNTQFPGGISTGVGGDWTGWHVFAVLWAADAITYYYDGVQVAQVTSAQTAIASNLMTLVVNQAMGGNGGPQVAGADFKVDYVHWYSLTAPAVTPQTGYIGPGDNGLQACQ